MGFIKSKKGFTLVELVVVIAILAIISAIAIPSVISIVNAAGQTGTDSTASEIDNACKEYFSLVISGQVNSTNRGKSTQSDLPARDCTVSKRRAAARNATVKNALEFSGLYSQVSNLIYSGSNLFVYDKDGTIYSADNQNYSHLTDYVDENLKLGIMYAARFS